MSEDRNNLAYWFPILQKTGVPVPRTEVIQTDLELTDLLDREGGIKGFGEFLDEIDAAAKRVGGYPVFLRTGHGSGKHDWFDTCYVSQPADLARHVVRLVDWSGSVDFLGLPTQTWVVREFLHLHATFTAFDGMPIAREFRTFIRDGAPICRHPYWPFEAIKHPSVPDWEARLTRLNEPSVGDIAVLWAMVERVAQGFDDYWSVDIAQTWKGEWVVTDMAEGDRSYHWPGCPHAPLSGVGDGTVNRTLLTSEMLRKAWNGE